MAHRGRSGPVDRTHRFRGRVAVRTAGSEARDSAAARGPVTADLRARQPKAVHTALTVLEEVARCGPGVTAREVSDNLGLPRATAYLLLNLLVQDEYVVRLPNMRGFALGRKVVELAGLVSPPRPPLAAREIIEELRGRIRCGVHLVRYEGAQAHVVDADPDFPLSDGVRLSPYLDASAVGRLLLTELTHIGRVPVGAVTRSPDEIVRLVEETERLGHSVQLGEVHAGLGCLAVPIRDSGGTLIGALCLSGPDARIGAPGALLGELEEGAGRLAPLLH